MEKLKKKKEAGGKGQGRAGVSAESYGKYNKKEAFEPVVVKKDEKAKVGCS
jgi:hypothetical protein